MAGTSDLSARGIAQKNALCDSYLRVPMDRIITEKTYFVTHHPANAKKGRWPRRGGWGSAAVLQHITVVVPRPASFAELCWAVAAETHETPG